MNDINKDKSSLEPYKKLISSNNNSNDETSSGEDIDQKVNSINDKLNNEIIRNQETQKLVLRERLNSTVIKFIWIQLIFFNIVVISIVLSVIVKAPFFNDINTNLAGLLFNFLKYYISATIVELLGMLVFILHYVFSKHSVTDLFFNRKK